ncbi:SMI1/KNR4 family protein [Kitasatospora sp. NPDC092286]|uniref:SMI1/KNR4 family protein n=1 Tax=Kitasatospora sp. NPDC092286 TaxID=3364087 RepID=UPI0037F40ED1
MSEWFERLRSMMGEPLYVPAGVPWEGAPVELGVQLPSDYRAFVDLYGGVSFAGEWGVYSPRLHLGSMALSGMARWRFDNNTEFRVQVEMEDEFRRQERTAVYPDPSGLLYWGRNTNHNHLCWITEGSDPDRWDVALWHRGMIDRFDGGFAEFVVTVLEGRYRREVDVLVKGDPEEWDLLEPEPMWRPSLDWTGRDWAAEWEVPAGSTQMPWRRQSPGH